MNREQLELPYELLIVDDEEFVREALALYLEGEGCRVHTASCGDEALQVAAREEIEAAIVDIRMPGMDGLTLLSELKRRHPDVEVLMATGFQSLETAVEAMRRGACDYITKPITDLENELLRFVRRAVERRRLRLRNRELSHGLQRAVQELGGLRGEHEAYTATLEAIEEFGRRTLRAACCEDVLEASLELLPGIARFESAVLFLVEAGRPSAVRALGSPPEPLPTPPTISLDGDQNRWIERHGTEHQPIDEHWFPLWGTGEFRGWILIFTRSGQSVSTCERAGLRAFADHFALTLASIAGPAPRSIHSPT